MANNISRTFEVHKVSAFSLTVDENDNPVKKDICSLEVWDLGMTDTKARLEVKEFMNSQLAEGEQLIFRLDPSIHVKWEKIKEVKLSMPLEKYIEQATVVANVEGQE